MVKSTTMVGNCKSTPLGNSGATLEGRELEYLYISSGWFLQDVHSCLGFHGSPALTQLQWWKETSGQQRKPLGEDMQMVALGSWLSTEMVTCPGLMGARVNEPATGRGLAGQYHNGHFRTNGGCSLKRTMGHLAGSVHRA